MEILTTLVDILKDIHIPPSVAFGAGTAGFLLGILSMHLTGCIARKLGKSYWLYFLILLVPLANVIFCLKLADMPWWYLLGLIIPGLNLVIIGGAWGRIARSLGKSFWLYAIGMFIPVVNVVLFILLAR